MNYEEYLQEILESGKEFIDDEGDDYSSFDEAYDDMFSSDTVTGNISGSFYCSSAKAADALSGVIFDERAVSACKELGYDSIPTDKGSEVCDVIVRCALLPEVRDELEEYWDKVQVSLEDVLDSMAHWLAYDKDIKMQEYPIIYDAIDTWHDMLEKVQERLED